MAIVRDLIPKVYTRLGKPPREKVSIVDIIITIGQVVADYSTELKLMQTSWFYQEDEFVVYANKSDFKLTLENFSRILSIEWINPYDPDGGGIEIQVKNFDDLDQTPLNRARAVGIAQTLGVNTDNIAHAMGFRGMNSEILGRVVPTPDEDVRYRIFYEPANEGLTSYLQDIKFPTEFLENLIVYAAADLLLPNCAKMNDDDKLGYNEIKVQSYRVSINRGMKRAEANFDWWKGQNKHQSVRSSTGFSPADFTGNNGRFR